MRLYLLILLFLLTGCYTQVNLSNLHSSTKVTHVLAIDSKGDTVNVNINQFLLLYNTQPKRYEYWRFYYGDRWINSYNYYSYNRPYYVHRTFVSSPSYSSPEPKKESKPRSSGTTTQVTRNENKSTSSTRKRRN